MDIIMLESKIESIIENNFSKNSSDWLYRYSRNINKSHKLMEKIKHYLTLDFCSEEELHLHFFKNIDEIYELYLEDIDLFDEDGKPIYKDEGFEDIDIDYIISVEVKREVLKSIPEFYSLMLEYNKKTSI